MQEKAEKGFNMITCNFIFFACNESERSNAYSLDYNQMGNAQQVDVCMHNLAY